MPRRRPFPLTRHDLYELCVQSPVHAVRLLRAIHAGRPASLGEDFAGTAAVSREWVRQVRGGRAVATDLDAATLRHGPAARRVRRVVGDALRRSPRHGRHDAIFVGNFSIGEVHGRPELVAYLRRCAARLRPDGVFVCDTYGGASAFRTGSVRRTHLAPDGTRVTYTWEQRDADPLTGMVTNAIHFRADRAGAVVADLPDAFVYRWRLWSVPELRDAMADAGFASTAVYHQLPDAIDTDGNAYAQPVADASELGESFIVCVAGRKQPAARCPQKRPRAPGLPGARVKPARR